jgi:alkaline phosphatase D
MTLRIDRRTLFTTAGFGLAGLVLPGGALMAQALLGLTGFTHNVASGEPGPDSMLLWTRYVSATGGPSKVRVEVSESRSFAKVVGGGEMVTGPWRDHTVKITVDGLRPGITHYYRFIAPDGTISPIGRTKTLPQGKAARFNIAIFSCANLGYGEFNAYGHAAARGDVDLVLHLGDYFYEYGRGGYDIGPEFSGRIFPAGEIYTLADYRLRYQSYRADPQLQALHAAFPMIPSTDDHEGANDMWEGGAQNHQPDEGDWTNRKNVAMQVWREWLPVGEQPWKAYDIGDLATYYRTDSRAVARSRPFSWSEIQRSENIPAALAAFRDGPWQDPAATMFGSEQESWLAHGFKADARARKGWSVLGSGTNIGYNATPPESLDWLAPDAPASSRAYLTGGINANKAGLPYNLDNWGGYPKAKSRLLSAALAADVNLIAVSGDSHNGWAFDLARDGTPAGVEFGGQSVTSPGMENSFKRADPLTVAKTLVANSKELRWMDAANKGYMVLSLAPEAATNEWVFMETIRTRGLATKKSHRMTVRPGRRVLDAV